MGKTIDTPVSRLDTVATELANITIEGYLFSDLEILETKTGLRILTLKITDETYYQYQYKR